MFTPTSETDKTVAQINFAPATPAGETRAERHATWLELLYDLCFVVAVGAVAVTLHQSPTLQGVVIFAALFIPVWWAWLEYAWYTTSFHERGLSEYSAAFAAMLTVLALAAQVGLASAGNPRGYLVAFAVFHAIVVLLFARAARLYPDRKAFATRYAVGLGLAAIVWLVSLAAPREMRPWIWAVALVIDLATPWVATNSLSGRSFDASHIPERYGLFTLIVLGESILAVARGTAEAHWTPSAVVTAVAGFVIAVATWWTYFTRHQDALVVRSQVWAFVWGYGHVFVWAGIAMTGVGIELAIEAAEAGHAFSPNERVILCGGFALYLAAMALLRTADAERTVDRVARGRMAASAIVLLIGVAANGLSPAATTIIVASAAVVTALFDHRTGMALQPTTM